MLIAHRNGMGATSVTLYRWIRMHISKVRDSVGQVQLSEINMLDEGGGVYAWPEGATCYNTTSHSNSGTFGNGETPDKLIDGQTSTKMCAINLGSSNYFGIDVYIDLGECVFDAQKWCKWCWYTANDNYQRDPVTFSLYLSTDAETWIPVDSCADVSITTTRYALAYTGDINLNMEYAKTGLVAWWDGIWNAGKELHDASATVWKDLSGNGYDGELVAAQLGTGYAWESNAFVRYAMSSNGMWTPIDISDKMLAAARSATFSVQIVTGAPVGSDSWTSQIFNLAQSATDNWQDGIAALKRGEVNGLCASFGGPIYGTTESFYVTPTNATSSVSLVLLGSTIALYDGTRLVGNKVASITPDATIAGVFARLGSSNYAYRGRYMRYSIYSRALTSDEIAANYAIDKARFNLS